MLRTWSVKRGIDERRRLRVPDKPLRLSWVTSNLSVISGHRYRLAYLERLRAAVDFDLYGRGFSPSTTNRTRWRLIATASRSRTPPRPTISRKN